MKKKESSGRIKPNNWEQFALDLAEILGLPKHVIEYELRFSAGEIPTVKCKFERWFDENDMVTENWSANYSLKKIKQKYRVSIEKIDEEKEERVLIQKNPK